jgi:hypothetical protein
MSQEQTQSEGGASVRRPQERRKRNIPVAIDRRNMEPGERKRLQGERRRQVDPTTCEKEYNEEEISFMKAMDQYKRDNRRPFPTWSEVLEVLVALGYRKVADVGPMPGNPAKPPPKG